MGNLVVRGNKERSESTDEAGPSNNGTNGEANSETNGVANGEVNGEAKDVVSNHAPTEQHGDILDGCTGPGVRPDMVKFLNNKILEDLSPKGSDQADHHSGAPQQHSTPR